MKTITVNGASLAYVDRGVGMPVVLVHGFPMDHAMWAAQIDAIARDYRVIVPDLRGFGQSGGVEGAVDRSTADEYGEYTVTMAQFADDLAGLLDALGIDEPVVLCGLSMGGYVALQFWHRYASRLRGLVLCDTRATADTPEAAAGRRATIDKIARLGPAPVAEQMIPKLFAPGTAEEQPHLIDALRDVTLGTNPRAMIAALHGMAERPDVTVHLSEIACPTLVMVGAEDGLSPPAEMRAMAEAITDARFVEIAGGGHVVPMERPEEVTAALREFLGDIQSRGL